MISPRRINIRQGIAGPGGGLFMDHPAKPKDLMPVIHESLEMGITDFEGAPLYGYWEQERNFGLVCEQLPPEKRKVVRYWGKVGRGIYPKIDELKSSQPDGIWCLDAPANSLVEQWAFGYEETLLILATSMSHIRNAKLHGVLLHDPPDALQELGIDFDEFWSRFAGNGQKRGARDALRAARANGFIEKLGVGCKEVTILKKLLEKDSELWNAFSVTQYSLMFQRDVLDISPQLQKLGIELHIAGPYAGGILSVDPRKRTPDIIHCNYRLATELEIEKARKMWDIAEHFGFSSLRPIAMQFVAANPAVHTIVMGPRTPGEVQENYKNLYEVEVPAKLWAMLKSEKVMGEALIEKDAPVPG